MFTFKFGLIANGQIHWSWEEDITEIPTTAQAAQTVLELFRKQGYQIESLLGFTRPPLAFPVHGIWRVYDDKGATGYITMTDSRLIKDTT